MNENHFTLLTKWQSRAKNVPRTVTLFPTRLLRFVVLLCIGLYSQGMNAQNVCTNLPAVLENVQVASANTENTICGDGVAELSVSVTGGLPSVGVGYGIDYSNDNDLVVFDLDPSASDDPFSGGTDVGIATTSVFSTDFVDGVQYGLDASNNQLHTISGGALSASIGGLVMPVDFESWKGIAFDASSGTTYAVSADVTNSTLYILDVANAVSTPIGAAGVANLAWLAIDADGNAYAASVDTDALYSIDLSTGVATLVGPTGVDIIWSQDADFDPVTGLLYTMAYTTDGTDFRSDFALIDVSTGTYNVLFSGPYGGLNATPHFVGFALQNTNSLYSYEWSTGETTETITVSDPGFYTVTVSDVCDNSDEVTILVSPEALNTAQACNGYISIQLGENGEAVVTPEMVLEGENGCLEGYTVDVGNTGSNIVDCSMLGGTYNVAVFDPSGAMVCWNSDWFFEDKTDPIIQCGDLVLSCTDSNDPDGLLGPITGTNTFSANGVTQITDNDPAGVQVTMTVPDGAVPNVEDVNVLLAIEHGSIDDLTATLTSPSGTTINLFARPAIPGLGCTNVSFDVVFDDGGASTNPTFESSCGVPAMDQSNDFAPLQSLSAFVGEDPSGDWTISVYDLAGGVAGTVVSASIVLEATFGNGGVLATDNCATVNLEKFDINNAGCTVDGFGSITRIWTATDGSGNESTCVQTITLTRPALTEIDCPLNWTNETANGTLSCSGTFDTDINGHPDPTSTGKPTFNNNDIEETCNFSFSVANGLPYTDVVFPGNCPGKITYKRTWMIMDDCTGDMRMCEQTIEVVDDEGPTITCPTYVAVNPSSGCVGNLNLDPPVMTDNCSADDNLTYAVIAVTGNATLAQNAAGFYNVGNLEVGESYEVTYEATDECGNTSTCTSAITVGDSQAPSMVCTEFDNVSLNNLGTATINAASTTGPLANDNCGAMTYEAMIMNDCSSPAQSEFSSEVTLGCCHVGSPVVVVFRVTDAAGNSNTCSTIFTVLPYSGFGFQNCPTPTSTILQCNNIAGTGSALEELTGVTQTNTGIPVTHTDINGTVNTGVGYYPASGLQFSGCGNAFVSIVDVDSVSTCGTGKVFRTYTVTEGTASASCTIEYEIQNSNPAYVLDSITLVSEVELACTDVVDPNNVLQSELPVVAQEPVIPNLIGTCQDVQSVLESTTVFTENLSPGVCTKTVRKFKIWDECDGQSVSLEQVIKVLDVEPIFVGCPETESLMIGETSTIDVSISNAICGNGIITYSIDRGNNQVFEVVDQIGFNLGAELGAIDGTNLTLGENFIVFSVEGCSGTYSCSVLIEVSGPAPPAISSISGSISNETNSMVENVTVSPASGMDVAFTDINGAFNMNLPTNENYNVTPEKDIDHLNGVSTYDLVLISKHLLQTELLSTPYKIIAGDVNNSGLITTLDLVELRKVILYINDEFPNNTSWRFVDANYVFPNATNPFEEIFPESYAINGLAGDMVDLDFVAVKIGDVNGSASTSGFAGDAEGRDFNGTLEFEVEDITLSAGQTHTFDVKANDFNNMLGYQFTMAFDGLEVMDVTPGTLEGMTAGNFGTQRLAEGMLTTSWNNAEAKTLADGSVLFSVTVKATADVNLSDALRASSRYTAAEAYADKASAIELLDVNFVFKNNNGITIANQFELYQNRPNPFKDETVIGFDLPQAGFATLTVFDLSGRALTQVKNTFAKGYNEVSINRSDLPATGVLYYELATDTNTAVRKMTIIE